MAVVKPFNANAALQNELLEVVGNACFYSDDASKKPLWLGVNQGAPSILTNAGNIITSPLSVLGNIQAGDVLLDAVLFKNSPSASIRFSSGNVLFNSDVRLAGNLVLNGNATIINTDTQVTDQVIITNNGTGPALLVDQTGAEPIVDFRDDGVSALRVEDGGQVLVGQAGLVVAGEVSASTLTVLGNAWVGGTLGANLAASNITTGIFNLARIPALNAANITSGTFNLARIPALNAANITGGTFNLARIPPLNAANITSGVLSSARIPNDIADGNIRVVGGLVGVGTGAPTSNLHVAGNALVTGNIVAQYFIGNGALLSGLGNLATSNTIDASQVASGTLAGARLPLGLGGGSLDLTGGVCNVSYVRTNARASLGGFNSGGEYSNIVFWGGTFRPNPSAYMRVYSDSFDDQGSFQFATQAGASACLPRMTITNSGRVGVGTTTPQQTLEVSGNCLFSSSSSPHTTTFQTTAGGAGATARLLFNSYGSPFPGGELKFVDTGDFSGRFTISTKAPGSDTNGLAERMSISASGLTVDTSCRLGLNSPAFKSIRRSIVTFFISPYTPFETFIPINPPMSSTNYQVFLSSEWGGTVWQDFVLSAYDKTTSSFRVRMNAVFRTNYRENETWVLNWMAIEWV